MLAQKFFPRPKLTQILFFYPESCCHLLKETFTIVIFWSEVMSALFWTLWKKFQVLFSAVNTFDSFVVWKNCTKQFSADGNCVSTGHDFNFMQLPFIYYASDLFCTLFGAIWICESSKESLPALKHSDNLGAWQRTPLLDRDCLGNDPQWVPGFLNCCSWKFQEQLRNKSELVGSEQIHQAWTKNPKYVTPSSWILWKVLRNPPINLFRNLGDVP